MSEICRSQNKLNCSPQKYSVTSNDLYGGQSKIQRDKRQKATYVANICAPRMPMVLGRPSIVNVDENNICNIIMENCAPYVVTL